MTLIKSADEKSSALSIMFASKINLSANLSNCAASNFPDLLRKCSACSLTFLTASIMAESSESTASVSILASVALISSRLEFCLSKEIFLSMSSIFFVATDFLSCSTEDNCC